MFIKIYFICFYFGLFIFQLMAQPMSVKGYIKNQNTQTNLIGINVYLKNNKNVFTQTNYQGFFNLLISDTLTITEIVFEDPFENYTPEITNFKSISFSDTNIIYLKKNGTLQEIVIKSRAPISAQFTSLQLEPLDVYFTPIAQGDMLKAITALPYSTNVDESANVSLRGSRSQRTNVIFNGVPIYNPVRNTAINGVGNFSLFNTEILEKEYIYPSNPPLIYGNSSAGIVDIETKQKIINNSSQISVGLSNIGFLTSQKIKEKSFFQIYANYQFSEAFLKFNKQSMNFLNDFFTQDIGFNWHTQFNKKTSLNFFNYFINENFDATVYQLNVNNNQLAKNSRNFSILNFEFPIQKIVFWMNAKLDIRQTNYEYGNIYSDMNNKSFFVSVNAKYEFRKNTLQMGLNFDRENVNFKDSVPAFLSYFKNDTNYFENTMLSNPIYEYYIFNKYEFLPQKLMFSIGGRTKIPHSNIPFYYSLQGIAKYIFFVKHSININAGQYHSFTTPNYVFKKFSLLKSIQTDFNYEYKNQKLLFTLAGFYKKENGESIILEDNKQNNTTEIFGAESNIECNFTKYIKLTFSNTYLNSSFTNNSTIYKSSNSLNYFIKFSVSYNHHKWGNWGITYIQRLGIYYTPIKEGNYLSFYNLYMPIYDDAINSSQYNTYQNLSVNFSKLWIISKNKTLLLFISLTNILNKKNEQSVKYNQSYTEIVGKNYLPQFLFYSGIIFKFSR